MSRCHWPWTKSCVLVHSGAKSTKVFSFKLRLCICTFCHRSHWHCKVGSNLPRVTCFPALGTGYMFSRAWHRLHVFPRLHPDNVFSRSFDHFLFFLFPLTSDRLYVLASEKTSDKHKRIFKNLPRLAAEWRAGDIFPQLSIPQQLRQTSLQSLQEAKNKTTTRSILTSQITKLTNSFRVQISYTVFVPKFSSCLM